MCIINFIRILYLCEIINYYDIFGTIHVLLLFVLFVELFTSNDQDVSIVTPLYTIATDLSILRTSIHYEGANERLVSRMRVGFKAMNTMDIYILSCSTTSQQRSIIV